MQTSAAQTKPESDAEVIAKHEKLVRHLASGFAAGQDAEDLMQEGYLALLAAWRVWQPTAQLWTYARPFVLGAMIRFKTKANKSQSMLAGEQDVDVESDAPSADELLEHAEVASKISSSMISLSEIERRIVRMHVEGQSLASIARGLDMSNDKTERIYRGAITKLRELVGSPS